MKNLAGVPACDVEIRRELDRARVPVVEAPQEEQGRGEVAYTIMGRLGQFEFRRAWSYWVVKGPVLLRVAQELYADPVGSSDVRITGHCACPPPEPPWITWRNAAGKKLANLSSLFELEGMKATWPEIWERSHAEYDFVADPSAVGEGFIELYHIDTEVGLRLFVDTLQRHGLASASPSGPGHRPDRPPSLPTLPGGGRDA